MTDNSPATDEELRALIGKALEPFASFAQNIDKDGWVSNIHREPISNWFGPSDFRSALEALNAAARIRAETAKNSGEVAAATDGKQIVTMAEEGAWQAAMIGKSGGPWSGTTLEALIDQYANGIYIAKISKPPLSVCVEHMREFATKMLALATPANSRAEAIGAAAEALLADVRRRYPGEELRCQYMRALEDALLQQEGE